ncbi:DUF6086 family protein [Streptomyces sp. NPDC050528]|uniref:DUF6086 family protein n=1 Tax=unclassified Streptomyces TaxID=2593676 RepID=UPI00378A2938
MSHPFELGDETLWDAGYHSGRLYAALAQGAAEFLKVPSGLTPTREGGCEVNPAAFAAFTARLYDLYASTHNDVLHRLADGLLVTSLVLAERAGSAIALRPEHEASLREEMTALAHSMA